MTVLLLRLDTVIQIRDFVEDRLCFDHRTGTVAGHSRVGTLMKSVVVVCDLTKKYKMNQCKVDLARKKKKTWALPLFCNEVKSSATKQKLWS